MIAADRLSTSGDSYIDFEFLQNTLTRNSDGSFSSAGPDGGRTSGDLLLSLAFTGGGKMADFFVWRWQTNGSGGFQYVDYTASLPFGRVFAALNSNSIAAPYGAFGQTNYDPNAFAEAAVDLTALVGNFDPCLTLGFKAIMIKTKASQSDSATIEDFIDPIQYTLKIGPSANAGLDLEMPGPTRHRGERLVQAVHSGEVSAESVRESARRVLRLIARVGAFDDSSTVEEQAIDRPEHRALIRRAGAEGMVLLKNEGVLPIGVGTFSGEIKQLPRV